MMGAARLFRMFRTHDVSGVSGVGFVAEGVEFSDGTTVIRWICAPPHSTVVFDSLADAVAVHGHDGATRFVETIRMSAAERVIRMEKP